MLWKSKKSATAHIPVHNTNFIRGLFPYFPKKFWVMDGQWLSSPHFHSSYAYVGYTIIYYFIFRTLVNLMYATLLLNLFYIHKTIWVSLWNMFHETAFVVWNKLHEINFVAWNMLPDNCCMKMLQVWEGLLVLILACKSRTLLI